MPKITGRAKRLRIYLCESDCAQRKALYGLIVQKVKELDLAGASVFRGLMGYGANSRIHTARLVALSCDLPVIIEIVDSEEYIAKILPYLDEVIQEGLVTMDDVEIIKYGKTTPKR
jgi:PII-like signaling protein